MTHLLDDAQPQSALSRREFLTGAALGAGGVLATSALPALAADDPALFPGRGRWERLSLAYHHISLGLEKPFSVLHVSDTHLTEADDDEGSKVEFARLRRQTFGGRQEEALRDTLAWARTNVDCVIHTGDLIDFQSNANLRLVKKYFGLANGQMVGAMGNHEFQRRNPGEKIEYAPEYNRQSYPTLSEAYPFDVELQSTVVGGVNFVTLDQTSGFVTERQVERFAAEAKKGLPIILCMHAPFMTDGIRLANQKFWRGAGGKFRSAALPDPSGDLKRQLASPVTTDFIAYLKSEKLLKGILSGHLHITTQERLSPTAIQYVVGGNFLFHGEEILFT